MKKLFVRGFSVVRSPEDDAIVQSVRSALPEFEVARNDTEATPGNLENGQTIFKIFCSPFKQAKEVQRQGRSKNCQCQRITRLSWLVQSFVFERQYGWQLLRSSTTGNISTCITFCDAFFSCTSLVAMHTGYIVVRDYDSFDIFVITHARAWEMEKSPSYKISPY